MASPLKVMVVDDTITYRMIMKKVAESISGVQVMATVSNGKLALDKITSQFNTKDPDRPDVVLLDVEMPVMDGLASLKEINRRFPQVTVVMVSGLSRSNANIVMECLNAGALDFITKPMESNVDRAKDALRKDLEPILSLLIKEREEAGGEKGAANGGRTEEEGAAVGGKSGPDRGGVEPAARPRMVEGFAGRLPPTVRGPAARPGGSVSRAVSSGVVAQPRAGDRVGGHGAGRGVSGDVPELILVGSSTGGPAALTRLLGRVGGKLPVPMLIVQHMPPIFTASLAAQLSRTSGLDVREAQDAQWVEPGDILIAQGGRHMTLTLENRKPRIVFNDGPKVNECRPAVDVLFMSVMACFSGRILAIVLTGMGRDGANGVDALKRTGRTFCITQDQKSCVVYGMPRSVDEKGLSDLSLPLDEIGPKVAELCGGVRG
ncbi:MAG: chemotaxis-specific protein-glutamate methyltransferase CheB [Magnetococcales bacterium]|nr:chemotaxis-specific protein-glutamate methyltransferase CheB [Magnetococcales bacterium]